MIVMIYGGGLLSPQAREMLLKSIDERTRIIRENVAKNDALFERLANARHGQEEGK